ncbi:MAG: hypothetical protein MJ140_03900 [Ligilactobacillus sp.]|nr:hypothetical protein [Ligilactobacillus sp.]
MELIKYLSLNYSGLLLIYLLSIVALLLLHYAIFDRLKMQRYQSEEYINYALANVQVEQKEIDNFKLTRNLSYLLAGIVSLVCLVTALISHNLQVAYILVTALAYFFCLFSLWLSYLWENYLVKIDLNLKNSRIISFEKNIFQQRCANLISGVIRGSLFLSLGYNFLPIIFSYFL